MAYADARGVQSENNGVEKCQRKKKVVVVGTGWAATSFVKNFKNSMYDVEVVSPRNYFAFTPLLPSVTIGTVESRSIVEPIRKIMKKVLPLHTHEHVLINIFVFRISREIIFHIVLEGCGF